MGENATEKQLTFIKSIVAEIGIPFNGTTKEEANEYISKHLHKYQHSRDGILGWADVNGY